MSNSVCVFVHLLFIFDLSLPFVLSVTHYHDHIPCLCTSLNNSLWVSYVFLFPAFDLFRFLKILLQTFLNMVQKFYLPTFSLIITCCCSLFIKSFCNPNLNSSLEHS